jgi:hypothetical protein
MKAFVSSVRRGLEQERDYLSDLIRAIGHEPSRFEDFAARDASSRAACLDGVEQADVYILLLGANHGDEMTDSGFSATEEEFNVARQRGIPVLVFKKDGVKYDAHQQEFIERLGDYQSGRFWANFDDEKDLGVQVVRALKDLEVPIAPVTYMPLVHGVTVHWRTEKPALVDRNSNAPVLELHILPGSTGALVPVSQLGGLAEKLAARARDLGFFGQADALSINHDSETAWAVRSSGPRTSRYGEREADAFAGLSVRRDGSAMIFQSLPTDMLGALVNQDDLQQRFGVLLRIVSPYLPDAQDVVVAAGLEPLDRVAEGDPSMVGSRMSGSMPHHRAAAARAEPVDQVARASFKEGLAAIAEELAVRVLQAVRATGAQNW